MGQAFDEGGRPLGEDVYGATKREVFDKLVNLHPDAHEIRIKSMKDTFDALEGQIRDAADKARPVVGQDGASAEMPKYRCHKEVWALQIKAIDGSGMITPIDNRYAPFAVGQEYLRKHQPKVGGYFVLYKDGYTSFSPATAFEESYTLVK